MDDKSALLDQLRIDRSARRAAVARARIWVAAAAIALLVAVAMPCGGRARPPLTGARRGRSNRSRAAPRRSPARSWTRRATWSRAARPRSPRRSPTRWSNSTSRKATTSSRTNHRRLDDTNIRAALNQASAQLDYAKAGLAETEVNLANAQREFDRQSSLVARPHFVSQSAVDTARTAHGCAARAARHAAQQHRGGRSAI
jgi:hypothetical protein